MARIGRRNRNRRNAVLAVAFEKGQDGSEGTEDRILGREKGIEKPSTQSWVVFADD